MAASPTRIKPDVLAYYLNTPAFVAALGAGARRLVRARVLMLRRDFGRADSLSRRSVCFPCLVISGIAIDWYLSLEAPFTSSSFGASVAITQLIAAHGLDPGRPAAWRRSGAR